MDGPFAYSQEASIECDDRHWSNRSTAPDRWRIGNAALRVLRSSFVHAYMQHAYKEKDAEITGDSESNTGNSIAVCG